MIRQIDIKLNAAHPELPLCEAVTYTGAPSAVMVRGVPGSCGRWAITSVFVAASYPDGSTTTRAAVQDARGVWVATIPATATSGRTANGIRILADGVDENGDTVTGYILGVADFAVASLDIAPAPAPGETSYQMLYFDDVPAVLRKGDVTKIEGVLKIYNGESWEPFADLSDYYTAEQVDEAIDKLAAYYITADAQGNPFATHAALVNAQTYYSGGTVRIPTRNDYAVVSADETHGGAEWRYIYAVDAQGVGQWEPQYAVEGVIAFDNTVTRTSANGVKSSGIWGAIWGALAALPTGVASLYDWCVAQLAGKVPTSRTVNGKALTGNVALTAADVGALPTTGGTVSGPLSTPRVNIARDGYPTWWLELDGNIGNLHIKAEPFEGLFGSVDVILPRKINNLSGTLSLAAPNPTAGHLAALDANGNPTDSGWTAGDLLTIVALTDSTETMASILARLDAINTAHKHVFFDCSGIDVNPRLYLCTIMIDADANAVRVYDQVTGKLYVGPYNATETIGEVFAKAVDAYYSIVVTAATLDGATVTGQTVTLREGADASAPVYDTAAYNGSPVTFVVPKGFQYFVEITPDLAGHFSPSTATGVANAPVSVTLTYQDTSNITDYIGLKGFLDTVAADPTLTTDAERIAFAQAALIPAAGGAKEIPDTFTNTAGTVYDNPMVVYAIDYVKGADGQMHLAALVQRKWCSSYDTPFDAPEGVACDSETETTAEDGISYYGLALGATSKTAANLTLLELSTGATLPYSDYAKIYKCSIRDTTRNSLQHGYNNWRDSAYRQHLNSSAAPGAWWSPTHVGDTAPSNLNSVRGYMAGCSSALLAAAKPIYVKTWPNYITDGANNLDTVYETLDTFFLPSGVEVYANVNMDGVYPVEGPLSEYWKIRMGLENPSTAAASTRIMYRELPVGSTASRSAASVLLRSAYRGSSNVVWVVSTSGQVSYGNASVANASVPACAIY